MRTIRAIALASSSMLVLMGCGGGDGDSADTTVEAICAAIDAEASDSDAFEGYELAIARERRDGVAEDELRKALDERCGRAIAVISAAGVEDEVEAEVEEEPEPEIVDVRSVDWADQTWMTTCTGTAGDEVGDLSPQPVTLTLDESDPESVRWTHRNPSMPDPGYPIYDVLIDGVVYGDATGDGINDAVFVSMCTHGNAYSEALEVWEGGTELVQLPEVLSYYRDGEIDWAEAGEGLLRVFSSEAAPGDSAPWANGYSVEVVTEWTYKADDQQWDFTEVSRVDTTPATEPSPEPSTSASPVPECAPPITSAQDAAFCLVAASNAENYDLAATVAEPTVINTMVEWGSYGPIEWEFNGCEETCWFYEDSGDPDYHGMAIEMGIGYGEGEIYIAWIDAYG